MIQTPSIELLHTDQLKGRFFHGFSCRIPPGTGVLLLCQQPESATELINMICGIEVPHSGTCQLKGQRRKHLNQQQWRELAPAIGFATGEAEMIHNLKVWENLILPLQARPTPSNPPSMDFLEERLVDAFQATGFNQNQTQALLRASPDSLSHFERTVCGLVRCHLSGFELLLGEQLFAETDPEHGSRLINLLNFLGTQHPESGLLLIHHGSRAPELPRLSSWQPFITQTLKETP